MAVVITKIHNFQEVEYLVVLSRASHGTGGKMRLRSNLFSQQTYLCS